MKGFGYNILSDKRVRPWAKSQCTRIPVPTAAFEWKGSPRPSDSYRGQRRNAPRKARKEQLRAKRAAVQHHENVI